MRIKTNGHALIASLRIISERIGLAQEMYAASIRYFPPEAPDPETTARLRLELINLETALILAQCLQDIYNTQNLALSISIKQRGMWQRISKLTKERAFPSQERWSNSNVRRSDEIISELAEAEREVVRFIELCNMSAAQAKASIGTLNAVTLEIEVPDQAEDVSAVISEFFAVE